MSRFAARLNWRVSRSSKRWFFGRRVIRFLPLRRRPRLPKPCFPRWESAGFWGSDLSWGSTCVNKSGFCFTSPSVRMDERGPM